MKKLYCIRKKSENRERKGKHPIEHKRPPIWQAILLPVAAVLIFFLLLEGGLALFGVEPSMKREDPFVGFASNAPLFVPDSGSQGRKLMKTATNKLSFFNQQSFPQEKPPETFRIFTLGGSTTYGRPYNDTTSFSGWLRELLPFADGDTKWEVINAGGISYASYRVAHLMEELVEYQPDLFIIYTGHNEFLEERTYHKIKSIPPLVRSAVGLLSRTRTWTAMDAAMNKSGLISRPEKAERDMLGQKVNAILDRSAGLDRYTRDESLQEKVLDHYRLSLERMVALARSVGAEVLFVTPASSLKDCSPFKSEHAEWLTPEEMTNSERLLTQANVAIGAKEWHVAHALLKSAVSIDPQHAEVQYRLGETLLALEHYKEAEAAFRRARDEDVCPLRALTPARDIVAEVSREQGVELLDFVERVEVFMRKSQGHPIPGEELFLDHVHPTIEGHKILALSLVEAMSEKGWVQPGNSWGRDAIAAVTDRVMGRVDQETQSQALANLARVLLWAGKSEDAARAARKALEKSGGVYTNTQVNAASILASIHVDNERYEEARKLLYSTLEKAPGALEIRLKLGHILSQPRFHQLEKGAAHLLLVIQQMPDDDGAYAEFAMAMARQGRFDIAWDSATKALRLNPKNGMAGKILTKLQSISKGKNLETHPIRIDLDLYPTLAPHKLTMVRRSSTGRLIPHGIEVEYHENGEVKRFSEMVGGRPHGTEKIWDVSGSLISHLVYRKGVPEKEIDLVSKKD